VDGDNLHSAIRIASQLKGCAFDPQPLRESP